MLYRDRVKWPILVPFTLILLLVIGAVMTAAFLFEERTLEREMVASTRAAERMFALQVDNHAMKLHAALCPISLDGSLKAAFEQRDREALRTHVEPLFDQLRERHGVTHFYLSDPDRRVFFRAHDPGFHGDEIERATTLQAQQHGRDTQGVELGVLGTLTLRAVKPWYQGDRLLGYLELGEEIGHLTEAIHAALGIDLLVLLETRFAPQSPNGQPLRRGEQESVILSSTTGNIPRQIEERAIGPRESWIDNARVHEDEQSFYTAMLPIRDAGGRDIGGIMVIRDVTTLQEDLRRSLISVAVVILLAGTLVFAFFYSILDRVEKDYLRQRDLETRFARLSTDHQRIVQIEKLSEVGRTISEIAHQLNNPLVGVINLAQLAEREVDDPGRVRQLLGEIRRAGTDSHAFLQRMLAFTRLSRAERKQTDFTALVRDTITLFRQSSDLPPDIVCELPDAPAIVNVDAILIRHALFNLLSNAVQANPPGGKVRVRLEATRGPEALPCWSLSVTDQGPGVPDDLLDKIFLPFFTTRAAGTGLGLAVVQHVAVIHDGTVTVENLTEGGAKLALWIPKASRQAGEDS
jgi:signal transduction histidine kinase